MKTETTIGLIGGVLLGESLKEISRAIFITPVFGSDPSAYAWFLVALVTVTVLTAVTDRFDG